MPSFSLSVPATFAGKIRLDKYVASAEMPAVDGMNRSKLKTGLQSLTVNGRAAKLSSKVGAGDCICICWEDNIPQDITPEPLPLAILYEDDNVTVINKRQGMVTHPASGNWSGTLVNALLYHWGKQAVSLSALTEADATQQAAFRPGIVHRLDKDTSGVIITARNRSSEEWLQKQFKSRHLAKYYIAIATGRPKAWSGEIKTRIVRDPHDRKRFKAVAEDATTAGKLAHTDYRCIASYMKGKEVYSLFVLRLYTGRTHQIRVHLKYIGCPILGDPLYGKPTAGTKFAGATLMLHARVLKIRLPQQKTLTAFKAPVPKRFRAVLKALHTSFSRIVPQEQAVQTGRGTAHGH